MINPKYYEDTPFYVEEDNFAPGKYRIKQNRKVECKLAEGVGPGFYDICQARILGLDYPNYISFCERNYDGAANQVKSAAGEYISPVIRFNNKTLAESLCLLLNKRWKELFQE